MLLLLLPFSYCLTVQAADARVLTSAHSQNAGLNDLKASADQGHSRDGTKEKLALTWIGTSSSAWLSLCCQYQAEDASAVLAHKCCCASLVYLLCVHSCIRWLPWLTYLRLHLLWYCLSGISTLHSAEVPIQCTAVRAARDYINLHMKAP